MPPPIRYPLPALVLVLVFALVAWRGAGWVRGVRDAIVTRWHRSAEGPPVPASDSPKVVAGPMIRRALLLRDATPVSPRPDARPTDAIARRMWVDVYDTWPPDGPATHLRVGNRRPIGWIAADDALPWDTRLVVRADRLPLADGPGAAPMPVDLGRVPSPVVGWEGVAIDLAVWRRDAPWSSVARRGWARLDDLPRGSLGLLLAREEIPALLSQTIAAETPEARDRVRLRAALGRVLDAADWSTEEIDRARAAMPARVFDRPGGAASERLAAANADPTTDASWGGHAFRFVPLDDLP